MIGSLNYASLGHLTMLSGATDTEVLNLDEKARDAEAIFIGSPSALEANTYTFLVSDDGTTFFTLCDTSNTAIGVPAAGKAIMYNGILAAFKYLKIHSNVAVGADRSFVMSKAWRG